MSRMNMSKIFTQALLMLLVVGLFSSVASATPSSPFAIGYISWDVLDRTGSFDITNMTGPNASSFPDFTFPVATQVGLTGLDLVVTFHDTTILHFLPGSYFTESGDGLVEVGDTMAVGFHGGPTSFTLTGGLGTANVFLNDGSNWTLDSAFYVDPATVGDGINVLGEGASGIIYATGHEVVTGRVPEPSSFLLLGVGVVVLAVFRRKLALGSR